MAKLEYRDNDNDELNPRSCFNGYALDLVKSLPFRSKKWLVTVHTHGTKLITHQDAADKLRIHIPIHTNNQSKWLIDGEEYFMNPGWAYLVNTTLPHSVENLGNSKRIHLYGKVWTVDIKYAIHQRILKVN
jgi:aspartyl/asparaginyl beta-hydroxylase (cupin superfamily)